MAQWVFCQGEFIVSDVIRWNEPIEKTYWGRRRKPKVIGDRLITAQVEADDGKWLTFQIIDQTIVSLQAGQKAYPLDATKTILRTRAEIVRGRPQRLLNENEDIRDQLHPR